MKQKHPRSAYGSPIDILIDDKLTPESQKELLEYWDEEVTDRLRALAEGMSTSSGSSLGTSESALAEEQRKVHIALEAWRERFG